MNISNRMSLLGTETAFGVLAKAQALEAKGMDVIHLEIGEPDFDTPENIRNAAKKALDEGQTHYCNSQGILPLRNVIAEELGGIRNIDRDLLTIIAYCNHFKRRLPNLIGSTCTRLCK